VTRQNDKGLLTYWPQLIGLVGLVFSAGVIYGKFGTMDEKQKSMESNHDNDKKAIDGRMDRQLEIIQGQEKRIIDLEKRTEYYRGLREGRQEATQKINSQ
jgi:hypothetical protein